MSAVAVTLRRTFGRARSRYSVAFSHAAFFGAVFATLLRHLGTSAESQLALGELWTISASPWLPVLVAVLGMDAWSGERASGRLEVLLSTPVRERDLVVGKILGTLGQTLLSLVLSLVGTLGVLAFFLPGSVLLGMPVQPFVTGLACLLLQGALWSAVVVMTSAFTRQAASAACAAVLLTVALPRGGWGALRAWWPGGATSFGTMPLDAQALDFASGEIAFGTVAAYLVLMAAAALVATKVVALNRLSGCGSRLLRLSTVFAAGLAVILGIVTAALSLRVNPTVDLSDSGRRTVLSARLRSLLAEADGQFVVTGFLSRTDPRFREVDRCLRALRREAAAMGGADVSVRFVDPNWDLAASERLLMRGARPCSLVFEKGRRTVTVGLEEGLEDDVFLSAFRRIATPPQRRNICWTNGHGESLFDAYGPFGMSDIARELARAGFRNVRLDLARATSVPSDCALVVVAGATTDFSRIELAQIESYLRSGGRLLVLAAASGQGGVSSILPAWGVRPILRPFAGARTLTGTDVLASDFAEHPVTSPLAGLQLVFDRPVSFQPSAAAEGAVGADRLSYSPLVFVDGTAVAVAIERGAGAGGDLALRPMRLIAVGDATFAQNGFLNSRANANGDFFMNCISYLAGVETLSAAGTAVAGELPTLDRVTCGRLVLVGALGVPLALVFVLFVLIVRRRARS